MDESRVHDVLERLAVHRQDPEITIGAALCATCVDVTSVAGASLTIHAGPSGDHLSVASSDVVMAELDDLERTLGEGPCIDAFLTGEPVAEPDLAAPETPRWLAFSAEALRAGARAAFGYPLQLAQTTFGAMNLYAVKTGALTNDQHANALAVSDVAMHVLVTADAVEATDETLLHDLLDVADHQLEIHQAAGMTSVQLGISIAESLTRLRAHAFVEGRPLGMVAADVVERRLRLPR